MMHSEDSLDNVFQTAAKMKEAQLKDKPERREWEAAPSFFKWTCGNYDQVQAARDCEDYSAKLATAQSFRQAGNELFVEEKFEDALMKRDGRFVDDVKLVNNLAQEPLDACEKAWEHLSSCFLNAASVLMRQELYKDAVYSCTKALEFKSTAKGHFRRAQSNYPQDTTYHLEQAVKDAQKAAELDSNDPKVKACLAKWRLELSQQNSKDQKSFKNIFKHGELYKSDEIQPAPSSGGAGKSNEIQPNRADALVADGTGWMKPPFTEEAKKRALEAGIDLEDRNVQEHLLRVYQKDRKSKKNVASSKGRAKEKYPDTYLEFWTQLLSGKLKWRWHYIFYVALVANSCWQTARILMAHSQFGSEYQPAESRIDDLDGQL